MTTQTTSSDASMIAPRAEPETKIRPRSALLRRPAEDEAVHLTVDERRARGQAQRTKTPRSSQSFWAESPDRPDPIALLESQAATRLPDLVPIRYARMRLSPFAFLRGSAIVMAHDLARTPQSGIQTQLCGDGHCSNFGVFASPERALLFDLNDLDETYPGPWEWDVKRLTASIYVAGRHNGFSEADCRRAVSATARSYRQSMAELADLLTLDVWYRHITAENVLDLITNKQSKKRTQKQVDKARQRTSTQATAKLTEVVDGHRIFANDPPLVMRVTEDDLGGQVRGLFEQYAQTLRGAQRQLLERFEVVDIARKVVGVGSVGTRCFMVLLLGRDDNDPLCLQVKEAEASVLEPHLPKAGYKHQGERVVSGLELMQPASDIFLGWMTGPAGRYFYWRQLRDMKGSAEVELLSAPNLALYGQLCGHTLARAHARASGNAVEIAAYLGMSESFDRAITSFAEAYADQTERDYQALLAAIKSGRIVAASAGE
jgi:uncharacterized protein (DUF2252 family)